MNRSWKKVMLHTHTFHSDGEGTLTQNALGARNVGMDLLCNTDHDTEAAAGEIPEAQAASGIGVVCGMEYTTFYGHILTVGGSPAIWQDYGRDGLGRLAADTAARGGVVGIAHPVCQGDPFCTGCNLSYDPVDMTHISFMEVWNSEEFEFEGGNLAFADRFLNQGFRFAHTVGSDFHHPRDFVPGVAFTWTLMEDGPETEAALCEALAARRTVISRGPLVELTLRAGEAQAVVGGELPVSPGAPVRCELSCRGLDRFGGYVLRLQSDRGDLAETEAAGEHVLTVPAPFLWLRAALYRGDTLWALTSPVFFPGA